MKINKLELFRVAVPFAVPYKLSKLYGTKHEALAVILKIQTDEGFTGLGEADPWPPFTEETPAGVMATIAEQFAPRLLGQDPLAAPALESSLNHAVHGNLMAKGAVSMALFDLMAQARGVPLYALLGGRVTAEFPILWGVGGGTLHDDCRVIEERLAKGFHSFMLKLGSQPVQLEIERVRGVHARFGGKIKVIADANQGWQVDEALRFVDGLRECPIEMLEQPLAREDLGGLKRVRNRCLCRLSADEGVVTPQDALLLVREELVDVFSLKISKNGGVLATKRLGALAEMAGLKCFMNSMLELGITQAASLHLGSTLTNLLDMGHAYGSVLRLADDITNYADLIVGAKVRVPDAPGLGVKLNEAKVKKYASEHRVVAQ